MNDTKYLIKYLDRYLSLPFARLLQEYNNIELEIINEIVEILDQALKDYGYEKQGEVFSSDKARLRLLTHFIPNNRTFLITIHDLLQNPNRCTKEINIEHFGVIRRIIIESPSPAPIDLDLLAETLKAQVIAAYTALEQAFISNTEDLERAVFKRIYDSIESQLKVKNKSDLFGRIWLFVGEYEVGFYYFDENMIRKVIKHYKEHQIDIISPVELTTWIMIAPLPYYKSLGIEAWRQKKPLNLPWMHVRYINDADKIFEAEVLLFNSESFSSYTISERRGFFLTLACPTEIESQMMPEIIAIQDLLDKYFQEGLQYWSPYVKIIKKLSEIAEESTTASFIGQVLGTATAEFFKNVSKP
jgi:hypothetical protein